MQQYQCLVVLYLISCVVSIAGCAKVHEEPIPVVNKVLTEETADKPKDVLIYIGSTSWITNELAAVEANKIRQRTFWKPKESEQVLQRA